MPAARALVSATFRVDRSSIGRGEALRAGLGVAVPLAVALAVGRPLDGAIAAGGAFSAGFAALTSGYRTRAGAVLLATVGLTVSTFVGAAVAGNLALLAVVLACWGFAAGMLVSLGVGPTIVGLQAVVGLLLITPYPMPVLDAAGRAGLVAAGGLLQLLIVVTLWPLRRAPVERRSLAAAYASLARYARAVRAGETALPDAGPIESARASRADPQPFARPESLLAFAALLDEADRLRTTLAALAAARDQLAGAPSRRDAVELVDELLDGAAGVLDDVAAGTRLPGETARRSALRGAGPSRERHRWGRLLAAVSLLGEQAVVAGPARAHVGASLVGELHGLAEALLASLDAVVQGARGATEDPTDSARDGGLVQRSVATLKANLGLRSVVFRHALRMGATLAVGIALAQVLPPEHRYWLPLTALVVLRPDFTSTFTRGLGRVVGTVVGAAGATALIAALEPSPTVLALLVTLTAGAGYAVVFANYAAFGLAVTCFVVFLLGFTARPGTGEGAVQNRIEATVLGGLLALIAYLLWPTWERVRLAEALARLLEAQRDWVVTMLRGYAAPTPSARDLAEVHGLRAAARRERVNADACAARAALEPGRRGLDQAVAAEVATAARRLALAALALSAHDPAGARPPLPALDRLAATIDDGLTELGAALRAGRGPAAMPAARAALHRAQRQLDEATRSPSEPLLSELDAAVLDVEAAQVVAALQQIEDALRRRGPTPANERRHLPVR